MRSIQVQLARPENVKDFVNITNRYSYHIDVRSGRHVVNAKSLLGIFSLDISRPITMEVFEDDCEQLLKELVKYTA